MYFYPTIQKLIKSVAWLLYFSGVHLPRSPLAKINKYKINLNRLLNFFCLNNLEIVEGERNIFFYLKYLFCLRLDFAGRGGSTTAPPTSLNTAK